MVDANPNAILAMTTPALSALRQQTPTIPLVPVNVADPVNGGFVESMARVWASKPLQRNVCGWHKLT